MSNQRAERWLRSFGYNPSPSNWIAHGKKPDFFCAGDPPVWVEVKHSILGELHALTIISDSAESVAALMPDWRCVCDSRSGSR